MNATTTVYCYDRYATHKRLAALSGLILLGAAALLGAGKAEAAPVKIERLPTVVIVGKAVKVERLPTVVVEGRRTPDAPVVAATERAPELKRVAYVPPAMRY
ncbi:hypothetical protein [Pelomonas sp. KK5]|uniref:hypothetical protein n=1 Tax=Pelomonas sp. KK5 TaxID=1855730 RepID=UPI00097C3477|nr:hypothetical protein [Pelomonas sp. KK5]